MTNTPTQLVDFVGLVNGEFNGLAAGEDPDSFEKSDFFQELPSLKLTARP